MAGKRALEFPKWLETLIVLGLLVMAVVEYVHDQWFFAGIFGVAGVAFGVSLGMRLLAGDHHGGN